MGKDTGGVRDGSDTFHAPVQQALDLLQELGAGTVDHPGGTLLDHLRRVHDRLRDRGARPDACLAALCHATYGTDGFAQSLLPLTDRDRLRATIGPDAEALVYRYASCDRAVTYARLGATPLPFTDRFTCTTTLLTAGELADFALLTIVNELDVAEHADLTPEVRRGISALVDALSPYAPL